MKINLGLKVLIAASLLALAGCMTSQDQDAETHALNAEKLKFINASSSTVAQVAVGSANPAADSAAAAFEKLGCPKLAALFKDFSSYTGQGAFPKSFDDHLACFGLSTKPDINDIDSISAKFKDVKGLLDCMCGGSALSDLFGAQEYQLFNVQASAAAQTYNAAATSAAAAFNASGSGSGQGYSGNGSAAGTYQSK